MTAGTVPDSGSRAVATTGCDQLTNGWHTLEIGGVARQFDLKLSTTNQDGKEVVSGSATARVDP